MEQIRQSTLKQQNELTDNTQYLIFDKNYTCKTIVFRWNVYHARHYYVNTMYGKRVL